ncbi:Uncharacterized protein HZ326_25212 [Fusarium oxysporum f. sp. albedinis]|nr:Uncharacterized protein HZ326_25212 [Fusarium oxysporum f. sp. albedinis]
MEHIINASRQGGELRSGSSSSTVKYCHRSKTTSSGIVGIEQASHHFTYAIDARDTLAGHRTDHLCGLAIDAQSAKGKGDATCDFDREEWALIDGKSPV